jgi:hypothetical protein
MRRAHLADGGLYLRWSRGASDRATVLLRGEQISVVCVRGPCTDSAKFANVEEALPELLAWARADPVPLPKNKVEAAGYAWGACSAISVSRG